MAVQQKTSESYTWGVWILWYVIISNLWAVKDKSILLSTCIYSDSWDLSREPTVSGSSSLRAKLHTHSVGGRAVNAFPRGRWELLFFRLSKPALGIQGYFSPITLLYSSDAFLLGVWLTLSQPWLTNSFDRRLGPWCDFYEPQPRHGRAGHRVNAPGESS